jgi:acyl-CoA synthetase (AMP-forming)/AMP-acid ligase II
MQRLLTDSLRRAETLFGDRTAVVDGSVSYDYATLASRARRLAGVLREHGVGPGDRLGVLMDNGHRYLDCHYGVPGSGAVLVPLNNRCAAAEHRYLLTDAGVTLLIADDANAEVAVIGVPDDRWGERVHAVVALRPGTTLTETELRDHCRELIAGYKCPRTLEIVEALPRSGPGKVLKQQLRKPHWQDAERQIN